MKPILNKNKNIFLICKNEQSLIWKEILKVIGEYSKALYLLDDYDHKSLQKISGNTDDRIIKYDECIENSKKLE